MTTVHKWNIKYEEGTGGFIKNELALTVERQNGDNIYTREDGSKFQINTRFLIRADHYEEHSFE